MPSGPHSMERDVYEKIAENGVLNGFPFQGMFVDAGTPESFVEATQACINSGRFSTGHTKDSTWFGNNVVNSGKIISSSVARNSHVGNGTVVENIKSKKVDDILEKLVRQSIIIFLGFSFYSACLAYL